MDSRVDLTDNMDFRHSRTIASKFSRIPWDRLTDSDYYSDDDVDESTHKLNLFITGSVDKIKLYKMLDLALHGYMCECCGGRAVPWNDLLLCSRCMSSLDFRYEKKIPWKDFNANTSNDIYLRRLNTDRG